MTSPIRHGWHASLADPKHKRVKDKSVYDEFHAAGHSCLLCGDANVQAAHLLGGPDREDVLGAIFPLCARCHGAWHGQAYREEYGGKRITPEMVRARVGHWILSPQGYAAALYLTSRLGVDGSRLFVEKLGVEIE